MYKKVKLQHYAIFVSISGNRSPITLNDAYKWSLDSSTLKKMRFRMESEIKEE